MSFLKFAESTLAFLGAWKDFLYLIAGVVLGAFFGGRVTLKAQKPRLVILGQGGSSVSATHRARWALTITNRPKFLGDAFTGETARDVHAWIRPKSAHRLTQYPLSWGAPLEPRASVDLEPGLSQSLQLFSRAAGEKGYSILDGKGEPIARFDGPETRFSLWLTDRLGRRTQMALIVKFDDSHLKNEPTLQILTPFTFEERLQQVRFALGALRRAFGHRR